MCLIANVNRDSRKQRPFKPSQFSPYKDEPTQTRVATKDDLAMLKAKLGIKEKKRAPSNKPQTEVSH